MLGGGFCAAQAHPYGNGNGRSSPPEATPGACLDPTGPLDARGAPNPPLGPAGAEKRALQLPDQFKPRPQNSEFRGAEKHACRPLPWAPLGVWRGRGPSGGVGRRTHPVGASVRSPRREVDAQYTLKRLPKRTTWAQNDVAVAHRRAPGNDAHRAPCLANAPQWPTWAAGPHRARFGWSRSPAIRPAPPT